MRTGLKSDGVVDEVDGRVGAAAGRREGADGALAELAGAEVEGQQAVGGGVGEEDFFAERGEGAAEGGDERGLADATGEGEDGEDGGAGLLLANGLEARLDPGRGCSKTPFEGVPAGGDTLAGALQGV